MKMKNTLLIAMLAAFFIAGCSEQPAAVDEPATSAEPAAEAASAAAETAQPDPLDEAMEKARAEMAAKAQAAQETLDAGQAYLHINAQKPGVTVTDSGLQYEVLSKGDGKTPGPTSTVVTHYHGTFTNGDVFDSSIERDQPATFPVNRVIAGWTEALQMMQEGDTYRLVIPSNLAYGERGAGDRIPPNSVLIFEVELIEVVD
jgi:FKBP-type peptidyl-prolyl cis-trans isomerase FklB